MHGLQPVLKAYKIAAGCYVIVLFVVSGAYNGMNGGMTHPTYQDIPPCEVWPWNASRRRGALCRDMTE